MPVLQIKILVIGFAVIIQINENFYFLPLAGASGSENTAVRIDAVVARQSLPYPPRSPLETARCNNVRRILRAPSDLLTKLASVSGLGVAVVFPSLCFFPIWRAFRSFEAVRLSSVSAGPAVRLHCSAYIS